MLTWHSFLQSVMFFVRSISVKVTKNHYRSSSVLMSGAVVIAVVAFSANGFGGGGKNAMAAPRTVDSLEADEEPETEALFEGSSFVTEAKIQFGLLNTGSEGQHLAGALLEKDVRDRQRRQADAQIEIEALQKQILKEKEEAEARRKAEEERRAARRIKVSDEDYQVLLRIVQPPTQRISMKRNHQPHSLPSVSAVLPVMVFPVPETLGPDSLQAALQQCYPHPSPHTPWYHPHG